MSGRAQKLLIVNADDFGLSDGVNRGIIRAREHGIVTSASLMVRPPAAVRAAEYAKANPNFSVGLHLDVGEWVYRDGQWLPLYEVVRTDDATAVADEVERQLDTFRRLIGRDPTHLDSHQHAHRSEPLRTIAAQLAAALGVPLRHFDPRVRYCGDFYGQAGKGASYPDGIQPDALARLIRALPPGVTELACHPGEDAWLQSPYRLERIAEVEALCHASVREALSQAQVDLVSFHALRRSNRA